MSNNITIIHSNIYDFEDPKTQKRISGVKLQYIFSDDLEPLVIDQNEKGYQIAEAIMPRENDYMIQRVPGVYSAKFVNRVNAKNQVIQKLVSVDYISTVPELYVSPDATPAKTQSQKAV